MHKEALKGIKAGVWQTLKSNLDFKRQLWCLWTWGDWLGANGRSLGQHRWRLGAVQWWREVEKSGWVSTVRVAPVELAGARKGSGKGSLLLHPPAEPFSYLYPPSCLRGARHHSAHRGTSSECPSMVFALPLAVIGPGQCMCPCSGQRHLGKSLPWGF